MVNVAVHCVQSIDVTVWAVGAEGEDQVVQRNLHSLIHRDGEQEVRRSLSPVSVTSYALDCTGHVKREIEIPARGVPGLDPVVSVTNDPEEDGTALVVLVWSMKFSDHPSDWLVCPQTLAHFIAHGPEGEDYELLHIALVEVME